MTRREVVSGGACLVATKIFAVEGRRPNLRVGILSDIHVDGERPAKNFEYGRFALEIYDDDGEGLDSCLGGDEFLLRRK